MTTICDYLKVNNSAKESLTMKYQEKEWIDIGNSPDEKTLIRLVLTRISCDVNQYHIFLDMLRNIKGMDIIVNKITGTVDT